MIKYRYEMEGATRDGDKFSGQCVSNDIIDAIEMYRKIKVSVHMIKRCEQVHADMSIGIINE